MQHKNGIKHASFLSNVFLARLVLYSLDLAQSAWMSDTGLYRAQGPHHWRETLAVCLSSPRCRPKQISSGFASTGPIIAELGQKSKNSKWPNEVEFLVRGGPGHQDGHNGTCPASIGPRVSKIQPKSSRLILFIRQIASHMTKYQG